MTATTRGDIDTVLSLMTDDVVFLVAGRPPFGKREFAEQSRTMTGVRIDGQSDVEEVCVAGDVAYVRNRLTLVVTPPKGEPVRRAGYALSVFRKENGAWAHRARREPRHDRVTW